MDGSLQAPHELRGVASAAVLRRELVHRGGADMVQGTHRVLRLHLGCRRPSVARNPRTCSTLEGGTALRRRCCWLAPPSPPPPPPPRPPPQGWLSLNPWRWRHEDGSRVGARVEAGRTRTARTAASRPNRTIEVMETTQTSIRKRGKSQSRYPHFGDFLVMLVDIFHLLYLSHLLYLWHIK